jgi:hypothetical protein
VVEDAAAAEAAARAANAPGGGGPPRGFGGGGSTLTEAGQAALAARDNGDRYAMSCVFTSIISEWGGEPVNRVVQRGDSITIQYGRLGVERTIHMDMAAHPDSIEPSLAGHSIGRWEGDTLIVDSAGFAPGLFNTRMPHSDALHVVEEFMFDPEAQQLKRSYTANDPLFWTEEQTGSNAMDISGVVYDAEPCEDLTIDEDAELGPRD